MDVHRAMATDYGKDRFGITLDERDLARICAEYQLPDPEKLPADQAMLLLSTECERFILVQAPKYGVPLEDWTDDKNAVHPGVRSQLAANREEFATVLTLVTGLKLDVTRERVGLPARGAQ